MIDRDLERRIKDTKEFIQLWRTFHDLYKSALGKASISPDDEESFLETKSLIARRYQALVDSLKLRLAPEDRTLNVISQVLSLKSVSSMADTQMENIEGDWHTSYITLNKMLGGLENKKEEISRVNQLGVAISQFLSGSIGQKLVRLAIFIAWFALLFYLARTYHFEIKKILNSLWLKLSP